MELHTIRQMWDMQRLAQQQSTWTMSLTMRRLGQCGMTYSNAHTTRARDQPAPNGSSRTASIERIREGGHDGGKEPTDTDGKGEGRQVPELSLEDRLVTELGGQLSISIAQFSQIDGFPLAIGAIDLDEAHAPLSMACMTVVDLHIVRDFGHDMAVRMEGMVNAVDVLSRPRRLRLERSIILEREEEEERERGGERVRGRGGKRKRKRERERERQREKEK
jgi:hypothetical protein